MREIVFDTETTGLDNNLDRVIEIGCVELDNRFPTGRFLHHYINAQGRSVHPEAQAVHGISDADLADKPVFGAVLQEFLEFIDGAKLVAHNANFDIGFINAEFDRLGVPPVEPSLVVDTLAIARRKHPMGPNSLDALCRRYGIDNSRRTKHGALLDAELLAEVYIELIGGKQAALGLEISGGGDNAGESALAASVTLSARPTPLPPRISEEERAAHEALVEKLGEKSLWHNLRA
ncbi:DNA polymerase III subunit epsilon [Nitratireductor aquimarinus]|uniref:DNA polymerase III subunit epsilon n=1 Tax=Alphaproteobacteria TaxID=28211 RepID=UPI0019D3ADCA|nr:MULTISPECIES: DNA polymerase III subunit epsilon [Alphaproteobacteria]MBY6022091.1 DNA polymerase III subunit epsilon [Nitratireductor sp. DP7N14-4]MBN7757303.1 DNA polymerase III subunit epsilon [Nitratireductor aquimarinus]MBN7761243.1 DNA polymerase III subunit epsilon [Nitratireductor aquibiodomus]MBN7777161.1 DNA polymerase III subunit epsilon [Nitratireductor pacificus]MBN7780832.1 DNA polymerase III subunit epsilon [Nitratireductor pacificus]